MQVGDGGALGTGAITDNAALVINSSGSVTVGGIISGLGAVTQTGTGTTTLARVNGYVGATDILSGTLAIGNGIGGNGSLGSGAVLDNATLAFNNLGSILTVANAISGSGSVIQDGLGSKTILTGASTYTGSTNVATGILTVDGSIASSSVTVSGGTLGGNGTVGATSVLGGATLAPGDTLGTLRVGSGLTLSSGSTYAVDISTLAADETIVSGTATLNGDLNISFQNGAYAAGKTYTILSATGGLGGTFAHVTFTGLPATGVSVSYDANLTSM